MKKYLVAIVTFLVLGAIIGAIVLMSEDVGVVATPKKLTMMEQLARDHGFTSVDELSAVDCRYRRGTWANGRCQCASPDFWYGTDETPQECCVSDVQSHEQRKTVCEESGGIYSCRSGCHCPIGLDIVGGKCSDPCRGALMCPPWMMCNDQTGYCVRDLSGRWRRESDGLVTEVTMESIPPNVFCPDTRLSARGFHPAGVLCIGGDESLTLCKTHAAECGADSAEGRILENGRRVEFTTHPDGVSSVYSRL